jgi:tripartite-type tricarboxylate transporter receptor subunit TctC
MPYQLTDFDIVTPLGNSGAVFFTRENGPIKTINDLEKVLPTLGKGAIGVAAADAAGNARAFVKSRNFDVPVVNFKNVNDVVTNVVGGHVEIGVAQMSTTAMWDMQESKQLRILGVVSQGPWTRNGQKYPSFNQTFNIPAFYSGSWLAITPGSSKEAQILKQSVLDALRDSELQSLIKEAWPMKTTIPLESIIDTANKHKDLLK